MSLQRDHATALDLLEAANGAPVSFAYLEEHGVRRPATVLYELEAAACPVERVFVLGAGGRRRLAGVRLHGRLHQQERRVPELQPELRPARSYV